MQGRLECYLLELSVEMSLENNKIQDNVVKFLKVAYITHWQRACISVFDWRWDGTLLHRQMCFVDHTVHALLGVNVKTETKTFRLRR